MGGCFATTKNIRQENMGRKVGSLKRLSFPECRKFSNEKPRTGWDAAAMSARVFPKDSRKLLRRNSVQLLDRINLLCNTQIDEQMNSLKNLFMNFRMLCKLFGHFSL